MSRTKAPNTQPSILLPTLRVDQWEIAQHPAKIKVVTAGRRYGKTVLGGCLAVATSAQGGTVIWAVPTFKNGRPLWKFALEAVKPLLRQKLVSINKTERTIDFANGGFLGIYSMENEDSARGHDADLVIFDEAAMASPTAWTDALFPTLADRDGNALLISTPKGRNWFYEEYLKGEEDGVYQKSFHAPTSANPNPNIRKAAERMRHIVPENTYRQEWLAEFLNDSGGVFRGVSQCATLTDNPLPLHSGVFVMGIDFGQSNDFTVLTVINADTNHVVEIDRFNKLDWGFQRMKVKALYTKWGVHTVLAEKNAVGAPNIEELQKEGLNVQPFVTTAQSKKDIIENLALNIEGKRIAYPNDPNLIRELQSFSMVKTPSGNIRYTAPARMHDDCVMSLALACQASKEVYDYMPYEVDNDFWY